MYHILTYFTLITQFKTYSKSTKMTLVQLSAKSQTANRNPPNLLGLIA